MTDTDDNLHGLTYNPFNHGGPEFYPGGQRKRLLDQLSHLSQWSRRSLLVSGVLGSGKSTLCEHLAQNMEPKGHSVRIRGEESTSRREVVASALRGFGVDDSGSANADDLLEELIDKVTEQEELDRLCVILVDDAHRLDSRAIELLLHLSLEQKVRIVLFAEPSASQMIEDIGSRLEMACHETQLIGLGQADVRGYIEWRLTEAGHKGVIPFTDSQIETIARISSGLPGRINELAGEELQRLGTAGPEQVASKFPPTHMLLLGMILVVFGLLYLLVSGGDDEPEVDIADVSTVTTEPGAIERLDLNSINTAAQLETGAATGGNRPVTNMQPAAGAEGSSAGAVQSTPLPEKPVNTQERMPLPAAPDKRQQAAASAKAAAANRQAVLDAKAAEVAAAEEAAAAKVAKAAQAAKIKAEMAKADAAKAKTAQAAAAQAAASRTKEQSGSAGSPIGGHDRAWLMQQDPSAFTLQLYTLSSVKGATDFVKRQSDPGQFATYSFDRGGKTFYVVLYGLYPSKAAASAASVALPKSFGINEPWVRNLGTIQQGLRGR